MIFSIIFDINVVQWLLYFIRSYEWLIFLYFDEIKTVKPKKKDGSVNSQNTNLWGFFYILAMEKILYFTI